MKAIFSVTPSNILKFPNLGLGVQHPFPSQPHNVYSSLSALLLTTQERSFSKGLNQVCNCNVLRNQYMMCALLPSPLFMFFMRFLISNTF